MYENNYNYIDVPDEGNEKKKDNKVGKTIAMLLAVAVVGGASGFGGAYLQNSIAVKEEPAAPVSSESTAAPTVTESSSTNEQTGNNVVNTLLNTNSSDGNLTTKQIVEKVSPSVVGVHSSFKTQSGTSSGTGTGIILSDDGYIITNAHVVQTEVNEYVSNNNRNNYNPFGGSGDIFDYFFGNGGFGGSYQTKLKQADKVTIVLSTDDETEYEAEIIGADENSDLAVLKINAENLDLIPAEFGDSNQLTMGDKAVAIGYPLGLGLSTSEGIVSGLNRTLNVELSAGGSASMTLIQTDAAINPGNSGGPLINGKGQVVGITSSKLVNSSIEGLGFAIPISDAMPLISDLMNKGYVTNTTPQIGITGSDINNAIMRYYNLPVDKGVMVVSVSEGSGAEAAGISAGDVIIAADGKEISSMKELTAAKKGKEIGDTMVLTIARADGNIDVTLTLTGEEAIKPEAEVSSN
ncbi:MAG: trypsin-like peptidase domain-containing protein [Oscillospiraceae bacterium]|nr:trypsin-like peptidase domain-containing protein [Oscillospiraceae bacterium]